MKSLGLNIVLKMDFYKNFFILIFKGILLECDGAITISLYKARSNEPKIITFMLISYCQAIAYPVQNESCQKQEIRKNPWNKGL